MVTALIGTIAMVWPSAFARATYAVPMPPLAPGLFSTTTGTPRDSCIFAPTSRLRMSPIPPGGYGTMTETGWLPAGNVCAFAQLQIISESRIRPSFNISPSSGWRAVNRLVAKLRAGHRHDAFPRPFLDAYIGRKVDGCARLEHCVDRRLVLQDADVLERIAVHHQHVGPLSRLERTDVRRVHREGRVARAAGDGLQRAHADALDEELHLARVPLAERREREPAVGAAHQRHALAVGVAQYFGGGIHAAAGTLDARRRAAAQVPPLGEV